MTSLIRENSDDSDARHATLAYHRRIYDSISAHAPRANLLSQSALNSRASVTVLRHRGIELEPILRMFVTDISLHVRSTVVGLMTRFWTIVALGRPSKKAGCDETLLTHVFSAHPSANQCPTNHRFGTLQQRTIDDRVDCNRECGCLTLMGYWHRS